jgi:hypothetical protein
VIIAWQAATSRGRAEPFSVGSIAGAIAVFVVFGGEELAGPSVITLI